MKYWNQCCKRFIFFRWADQCKPTPHDKNRRTDEFSYVGQNYAWRSYSNPERQKNLLGGMVEMWYNEVTKNCNKLNNSNKTFSYSGGYRSSKKYFFNIANNFLGKGCIPGRGQTFC